MAASKGKYRTEIDPLLRRYEMPGTVRDQEGKSILHHIASAKTADHRPLWTHLNVENFMADYMCVPNAVDYEGISSSLIFWLLVDLRDINCQSKP